jgi:hypothetical protein
VGNLEFEAGGLSALAGADNAVGAVVTDEGEVNLGFDRTDVNNVVFGGTAFSPQGPGDRFEKRRFSGTVGSTNAGGMNSPKIQTGFSVAEEVFKNEALGNHADRTNLLDLQISSTIALQYDRTSVQQHFDAIFKVFSHLNIKLESNLNERCWSELRSNRTSDLFSLLHLTAIAS